MYEITYAWVRLNYTSERREVGNIKAARNLNFCSTTPNILNYSHAWTDFNIFWTAPAFFAYPFCLLAEMYRWDLKNSRKREEKFSFFVFNFKRTLHAATGQQPAAENEKSESQIEYRSETRRLSCLANVTCVWREWDGLNKGGKSVNLQLTWLPHNDKYTHQKRSSLFIDVILRRT